MSELMNYLCWMKTRKVQSDFCFNNCSVHTYVYVTLVSKDVLYHAQLQC